MIEAVMAALGYVAVGWLLCWAAFKWCQPESTKALPVADRTCTFCIMWVLWPLAVLFVLACMAMED